MTQQKGNEKIGIGIITCNRLSLFRQCISSIPKADHSIVVNDGNTYSPSEYPSWIETVIQHKKNKGVGRSKNEALTYLLNKGCTHIFLCEDDLAIINQNIYNEYIHAAHTTGILHFNFAFHGPRNKNSEGKPVVKLKMIYDENASIIFVHHLVGAFSYYHKNVLQSCGLMDTIFNNVMEHVDHSLKIIRKGFHPPFWWFADINGSYSYIKDLDPDLANTAIHHNGYLNTLKTKFAIQYFKLKNHYKPWNIPEISESEVERILKQIQHDHSIKFNEGNQ